MKKITTLLIAYLVALQAFNAMAITTSDYVIDEGTLTGDVNRDEAVTASDVTELYNYLLNGSTTYYSTSDVNGDGSVTSADISLNKINH